MKKIPTLLKMEPSPFHRTRQVFLGVAPHTASDPPCPSVPDLPSSSSHCRVLWPPGPNTCNRFHQEHPLLFLLLATPTLLILPPQSRERHVSVGFPLLVLLGCTCRACPSLAVSIGALLFQCILQPASPTGVGRDLQGPVSCMSFPLV